MIRSLGKTLVGSLARMAASIFYFFSRRIRSLSVKNLSGADFSKTSKIDVYLGAVILTTSLRCSSYRISSIGGISSNLTPLSASSSFFIYPSTNLL